MSKGVNKVIIIGNVGQDPEVRFLPSGVAVANVSIATSEKWKDKQSGQQQERTEWHRCVFFDKLAEIVQQYVKKGSRLYVEGQLQTRKWQAQDGSDRYSTEIKVRDMQMLDSPGQGQQRQPGQSNSQGFAGNGQPQQSMGQQGAALYGGQQQPQGGGVMDDDSSIPF